MFLLFRSEKHFFRVAKVSTSFDPIKRKAVNAEKLSVKVGGKGLGRLCDQQQEGMVRLRTGKSSKTNDPCIET